MRILSRNISNRWLLLLIPLLILLLPVLLIGFFAANNLAGAIFGPPAIWNRTRNAPLPEDLAGFYKEFERNSEGSGNAVKATLELHSDSSMDVHDLPVDEYFNTCVLSGTGQWLIPSGSSGDYKVGLVVNSDGKANSCKSGEYPYFIVAGQAKPYQLYWVLGDPDSGTGVWLKRE